MLISVSKITMRNLFNLVVESLIGATDGEILRIIGHSNVEWRSGAVLVSLGSDRIGVRSPGQTYRPPETTLLKHNLHNLIECWGSPDMKKMVKKGDHVTQGGSPPVTFFSPNLPGPQNTKNLTMHT